MEKIQHSYVQVGNLKLHVAEIGTGEEVVVFVHGFPEIWYSWRYQMLAISKAGYKAIAFDCRGYGLSDQPAQPENTTFTDFSNDVVALLDALGIDKVFLVGKDSGSIVLTLIAVLHPDRVRGCITLDVPFLLPSPSIVDPNKNPEGHYILRWQEPGRAEADFGRFDVKSVIRNIYILFSRSEVPIARKDEEIMDLVKPSTPLPSWFSEEDLTTYATLYENSGFRTALQVPYRQLSKIIVIKDPVVKGPAMFIMGEKDYVLKFPGMEENIKGGALKKLVPELEIASIPRGTHFLQEQLPEEVNQLIISFLNKFSKK